MRNRIEKRTAEFISEKKLNDQEFKVVRQRGLLLTN